MNYFSGLKSFWAVPNKQLVLDKIKKLGSRNKALSIDFPSFIQFIVEKKNSLLL